MESIDQYMRQRKVPNELQKRIKDYYDYMWSSHQSLSEKGGVMDDLHPSLQLELHISLNRTLIENVPMFKLITNSECLIDMIEKLKTKIYIPGEYIVLQNEIAYEMYVIVRGLVHVLLGFDNDDKRAQVATLKVIISPVSCNKLYSNTFIITIELSGFIFPCICFHASSICICVCVHGKNYPDINNLQRMGMCLESML